MTYDPTLPTVTYSPAVFDVADEDAARRIILTPDYGESTETRWERETPYVTALAVGQLALRPSDLVVDFGCGIGRMAKALIESVGCRVLGVDFSRQMQALAPSYVESPNFSVVSPEVFRGMVDNGLRADHALAIWVLQHVSRPAADIQLLADALKPGGGLLVVNLLTRAIPTTEHGWVDDRLDVRALLAERFTVGVEGRLHPAIMSQTAQQRTFWARYDRP
ncbi:MAG: Methyltransferase type 11 [Phenylobacterium sp.]|nr:Methyltransferase type 11 [Phenylobacterium sp.]